MSTEMITLMVKSERSAFGGTNDVICVYRHVWYSHDSFLTRD